jgi:hypothetical protein
MEPTKREQRQIKKEIKRAGSQRRRRQWKRDLRENPEAAPYSEDDFGRYSSAALNGMDQDHTRRRGPASEGSRLADVPVNDSPFDLARD